MAFLLATGNVYAETLEEKLNDLEGPKKQYETELSPVYIKTNTTSENISSLSGNLSISQTDYVLPGRNGLDVEIKRIYKSGTSNVQEMKVKYVNGAWVDYVDSNEKTSSFYEDRYNLGIGMRFSFPMLEVRENKDGTNNIFLHAESGDVYRIKHPVLLDGIETYLPEGQTILDVMIRESNEFSNGQSDGTSKYVMLKKDGKKTYFAADGRVLGIVDRYGNTITFKYDTLTYSIDGTSITKRLISSIVDTVGREVKIEYKEDHSFQVKPISNSMIQEDKTYEASQNPNNVDSGDLENRFQVIVTLPDQKKITYDKSAVLVNEDKSVIRTRLQRVYDIDGKVKYHYWYEQPSLGFSYSNGENYSVYNRYENLVQIDYVKINKIDRYTYDTFTKNLNTGSMEYRKVFAEEDLQKLGYDSTQSSFLDGFITEAMDKTIYTYTNEPDGYGQSDYTEEQEYLKSYRYQTSKKDLKGISTTYTYDGLHQLLDVKEVGEDHKRIIKTEHDEMKLINKKEETFILLENGEQVGDLVKEIENYRYDEYGNLTNFTGVEAERDENGIPINNEHTVIYTYDYSKYHVPTSKTFKKDRDTTCQFLYELDNLGNMIKETKNYTEDGNNKTLITTYQYDSFGNMTHKEIQDTDVNYVTDYEYGIDIDGVNHKGLYMTSKTTYADGIPHKIGYAYNPMNGLLTKKQDPTGNRVQYEYDLLGRITGVINKDGSTKQYIYYDQPYNNREIEFVDEKGIRKKSEYDALGGQVKTSVFHEDDWQVLATMEYDSHGNKTKVLNANGHSVTFEYNSQDQLTKKSWYEDDAVSKGVVTLDYSINGDGQAKYIVTMTDEEGYKKDVLL